MAGTPRQTKPPVALTAVGDFGTGITAVLTSVTVVRAKAHGPGEVSGPAVRVAVNVHNATDRAVDLGRAILSVTVRGGPTVELGSESRPLPTRVAAGRRADGVFVYSLPPGPKSPILVSFSYGSGTPVVLFSGSLS